MLIHSFIYLFIYSFIHSLQVVADCAAPPWRQTCKLFDAIITDPPYGIREPTEKVGTTRKNPEVPKEFLEVHFPQKVNRLNTC